MTDQDTAYCLGYALAGISQALRKIEAGKEGEACHALRDTLAEVARKRKGAECSTAR